ncbi:serine/threonine-protein kinase Nek2 isoform X2 [Scleropages formosus]|uniref:serine/threonine-protein kinase Nek2 isoform X2 n=1 Tax=Scleropages formosus TaxID=113540 RepID=UPI0010FAA7C6|nr:serine/threonine-protein kinase Nek2 isoform X2 [Scleropages formosus]
MPSCADDYEILHAIGSGSFGQCQKIRRKSDGKILVWKVLDYGAMAEAEKQMLVSEVNLLRELKHPNIVRYYDRIVDRTNKTLYIIMEHCEGGDLSTIISKCIKERRYLEEDFILRVLTQLSLALKECHRRGSDMRTVLHRDLKPANIFLDVKKNVKLGDFGLARILNHDTSFAKTFVGTPYYMSPEQINRLSYDEKSDIWSLGCLVYELCALSELNTLLSRMLHLKDYMRPSVESILQSDLIAHMVAEEERRIQVKRQRRPSQTEREKPSDCPSLVQLKLKEQQLQEREKALKEREERLEKREQELLAEQRLFEEKLARAHSLLKNYRVGKVQEAPVSPVSSEIDEFAENRAPGKVSFAKGFGDLQSHALSEIKGSYQLKSLQILGFR